MSTTSYTAAECADFATKLAEAEAAYHDLAIGNREVEVMHANKRVRYTEANAGTLLAYIAELRGKVKDCAGCRHQRSFRVMPIGD